MTIMNHCPDGGACHHECARGCFRVHSCGPLSNVYVNDEWPKELREETLVVGDQSQIELRVAAALSPPPTRICRDEDCPACGWPETYYELMTLDGSVGQIGCSKCGWVDAVEVPKP